MQTVTILGATGSIGRQALAVIALHPERYQIEALTAHHNIDQLFNQCQRFKPRYAVVVDVKKASVLQQRLCSVGSQTKVLAGHEALVDVAKDGASTVVIAAIVGAAGLLPTLAAVQAGKRLLLANKEALVMAGALFVRAAQNSGATILPVDSEHNAIFQCMPDHFLPCVQRPHGIRSIILTASGGPFLHTPLNQMSAITLEQALAHPTWSMGPKISIDSATMMNKGLEVIEAYWLFQQPLDAIEVIIHPQSVIHSMVKYQDGSILAELGHPDMRTPIASALAWPERMTSGVADLDLVALGRLDFLSVPKERYPCFQFAYQALEASGNAACLLNAANEVAVAAFLAGRIKFTKIAEVIEAVLNHIASEDLIEIEAVLLADAAARELAERFVAKQKISVAN